MRGLGTRWSDAAILGIGRTEFEKRSAKPIAQLAVEASLAALRDSGITRDQVDGVVTFTLGDTIPASGIATLLGLPSPRLTMTLDGGGNVFVSSIGYAAAAVLTGIADCVLCVRALKARSGKRLGGTGEAEHIGTKGIRQFTGPYGWTAYAHTFALAARRYMVEHGISDATMADALARVVTTERLFASANPRAIMRSPVTVEDYVRSPMICEPLRLLDCCLESDGACALIVSRAPVDSAQGGVRILGFAEGGGRGMGDDLLAFLDWEDWATIYAQNVAPELYATAGVRPSEIDFAMLYDCFSSNVLMQLEGFGFCDPGAAPSFISAEGIGAEGALPVNPHGGLIGEAYVHGMNGVAEAIDQLLGRSEGTQLRRHKICMVASGGIGAGSAMILAA